MCTSKERQPTQLGGNGRRTPDQEVQRQTLYHWAFKKCCISNALDGTEDDMLWEDNVRGNALHTDTTTEVDDPREPYSDEIPQDIWHELFDDVDDDDDDSDTENWVICLVV